MRNRNRATQKLKTKVSRRQEIASLLNQGLKGLDGLEIPYVPENQTHSYYMYPIQIDANEIGISKDVICKKLFKLKDLIFRVDIKIYIYFLFTKKKLLTVIKDFLGPLTLVEKISHTLGICPNAEELNEFSYIGFGMCTMNGLIKT